MKGIWDEIKSLIAEEIREYDYDDRIVLDKEKGTVYYLNKGTNLSKVWRIDLEELSSVCVSLNVILFLLGYTGFIENGSYKIMNYDEYAPISVLDYLNSDNCPMLTYSGKMMRSLLFGAVEATRCDIGGMWGALGYCGGKVLEFKIDNDKSLEIHGDRNLVIETTGRIIFDGYWECVNSYTELEVLGAYLRACRVARALVEA